MRYITASPNENAIVAYRQLPFDFVKANEARGRCQPGVQQARCSAGRENLSDLLNKRYIKRAFRATDGVENYTDANGLRSKAARRPSAACRPKYNHTFRCRDSCCRISVPSFVTCRRGRPSSPSRSCRSWRPRRRRRRRRRLQRRRRCRPSPSCPPPDSACARRSARCTFRSDSRRARSAAPKVSFSVVGLKL